MFVFSIFCLAFAAMIATVLIFMIRNWIAHKPFLNKCPNWVMGLIWCLGFAMVIALIFAAAFTENPVFIWG